MIKNKTNFQIDAYSPFNRRDLLVKLNFYDLIDKKVKAQENNDQVAEATEKLFSVVIPLCANEIVEMKTTKLIEMKRMLHTNGVNLR